MRPMADETIIRCHSPPADPIMSGVRKANWDTETLRHPERERDGASVWSTTAPWRRSMNKDRCGGRGTSSAVYMHKLKGNTYLTCPSSLALTVYVTFLAYRVAYFILQIGSQSLCAGLGLGVLPGKIEPYAFSFDCLTRRTRRDSNELHLSLTN